MARARPFCVDYYWENWRICMSGLARSQRPFLFSSGVNQFNHRVDLMGVVTAMLRYSFDNTQIYRYRMNNDVGSKIAHLLSHHLKQEGLTWENVALCYGSTDGLDMVLEFCRENGIVQGALPLGGYYGYDVAIAGNDLEITDYFSHKSSYQVSAERDNGKKYKRFLLRNIPDAISGCQEVIPPAHLMEEGRTFTIFDSTCQLLDLCGAGTTRAALRRLTSADNLRDSCLTMTISKDLTLPGLRSGLVVSRNKELMSYLRDRVERRYDHVGSLSCYAMLFYVYCLLLDGLEQIDCSMPKADLEDIMRSMLPMLGDLQAGLDAEVVASLTAQRNLLANARGYLATHLPAGATLPTGISSGFTSFPELPFDDPSPVLLHKFSLHMRDTQGIWVTPMYSFSGSEAAWTAMQPDRINVRVNLSNEVGFRDAVDRFLVGWDHWTLNRH